MAACRKQRFASKRMAHKAATSLARRNGDRRMSAYFCGDCHGWHLTSKASRTT